VKRREGEKGRRGQEERRIDGTRDIGKEKRKRESRVVSYSSCLSSLFM